MSEAEKAMVIERMAQLPENDRTFIMGVLAGLAVKQERQGEKCCGKCSEQEAGNREQAVGNRD